MKHESFPFNYLGVPLFKGKPKSIFLKSIVDKIFSHFDAWNGRLLSFARRVFRLNSIINSSFVHACLLNSIITSSFVHTVMIYRWHVGFMNSMQKAMKFFYGYVLLMNHENLGSINES